MDEKQRPKVGVGVYIIKDGKVLFGKRKNAHAEGAWCPPGGHLEFLETPEDCARREALEEVGLKLKNVQVLGLTNDIFKKDNKHYITVHLMAEIESGAPKLMEPDKCEKWEWFDFDSLPTPLMVSNENFFKSKFNIFKK